MDHLAGIQEYYRPRRVEKSGGDAEGELAGDGRKEVKTSSF